MTVGHIETGLGRLITEGDQTTIHINLRYQPHSQHATEVEKR